MEGHGRIIYPGPLFPNNFSEIEKLNHGGYYLYDNGEVKYVPVEVCNVVCMNISGKNKTPEQIESEIYDEMKEEFVNTVVTIRVEGRLLEGKPSQINFAEVFKFQERRGKT